MNKYYSALGVHPSADLEEIAKAYRQKLKMVHPDRFDARKQLDEWNHANKMLQELIEAYDWIKKNHTVDHLGSREEKTTYQKTEHQYPSGKTYVRKERGGYAPEEQNRKARYPYAVSISLATVICIAIIATITLTNNSETPKPRSDRYASREAQHVGNQNNSSVAPVPAATEFNHESQPLPPSGREYDYSDRKGVAPLQIVVPITAGDNYYVKVVTLENQPVKEVFIRAGDAVKIRVPLGTYKVKYAYGKIWYGEKHLFGPGTRVTEVERNFVFRVENKQNTGYALDLINQDNGNLHSRNISIKDF